MNNKLVFVISFLSAFIILETTLEVTSSINAQGDAFKNTSASGVNTTSATNSISIITPWNTGNERNNNATNSIG
ncbi:MAG TPA: hypothetical protein VD815_00245 [Candidatus Saccharimonadales bacterium]|nr:hypothetical protein [Candidatus Saccharimonadales bacterium]